MKKFFGCTHSQVLSGKRCRKDLFRDEIILKVLKGVSSLGIVNKSTGDLGA